MNMLGWILWWFVSAFSLILVIATASGEVPAGTESGMYTFAAILFLWVSTPLFFQESDND